MRSTCWNKIVIEETYRSFGIFVKVQAIVLYPRSTILLDVLQSYFHDLLDPVLADLCAHSEQWEEASIRLPPVGLEHLCSVRGRLSLLKKLEISVAWYVCTCSTIAVPGMVTNVFEDAPLLTY